ncbi:hypothetical protein MMEU_3573 [Mycobacterium marinum str. Europe]|nr:hypothetical protein MMEU_3573 [Mycobacterium marinum str. Europe]
MFSLLRFRLCRLASMGLPEVRSNGFSFGVPKFLSAVHIYYG